MSDQSPVEPLSDDVVDPAVIRERLDKVLKELYVLDTDWVKKEMLRLRPLMEKAFALIDQETEVEDRALALKLIERLGQHMGMKALKYMLSHPEANRDVDTLTDDDFVKWVRYSYTDMTSDFLSRLDRIHERQTAEGEGSANA